MMIGSLLVDECLAPSLAAIAIERGYHARPVTLHRRAGTFDWSILDAIDHGSHVLVTADAAGFIELFRRHGNRQCLFLAMPMVDRAEQHRLFERALDFLDDAPDLNDRFLRIGRDGKTEIVPLAPSNERGAFGLPAMIHVNPHVMGGMPCVRGTRIPAETIVAYLKGGASDREIMNDHRTLPHGAIDAVRRWALDQGIDISLEANLETTA